MKEWPELRLVQMRTLNFEPLMTANCPVQQCQDNDAAENWTCVVHVTLRDREYWWEGYPNGNVDYVDECDYVDGDSVAAEFVHAKVDRLSTDLSQQHEKYWWYVRNVY